MSDRPDMSGMFNPFDAWRQVRDANVDAWSKMMAEFVNSEAYAQASGNLLDQYLTASQPFRQVVEKLMTQALTAANMPTREDVIRLADRLTNVEMLLDNFDARLERLEDMLRVIAGARERSESSGDPGE